MSDEANQQQQQTQQTTPPAGSNSASGNGTASSSEWYSAYDNDTKGWLDQRGLTKVGATEALPELIKGYRGAEQKLGVPADQLIRMPNKDAKPEEQRAFLKKIGASDNAADYKLPIPDGEDPAFANQAALWFSEIGVPVGMGQKIAEKWNTYVSGIQEQQNKVFQAESEKQMTDLRAKWGGDADKNTELARRAFKAYGEEIGLDQGDLDKIERSIGTGKMMQLFSALGKPFAEDMMHGKSDTRFGMTPEAAKARIEGLKRDTEWQKSFLGGDVDKKAEWTRLHQTAFPEEKAA